MTDAEFLADLLRRFMDEEQTSMGYTFLGHVPQGARFTIDASIYLTPEEMERAGTLLDA